MFFVTCLALKKEKKSNKSTSKTHISKEQTNNSQIQNWNRAQFDRAQTVRIIDTK